MLSNNYFNLKQNELKIFKQLQFIFNEYLYNPRHEPIDIKDLLKHLKTLGNLIHIVIHGKKKTSSIKSSDNLASGIKTRKNSKKISSSSIFKRKPLIKRFKKPLFLSIK